MRDNRLVSVEDVLDTLRVLMNEYKDQEQGTLGSWAPEIAAAVREIPSARESICWHDIREELPPVGSLYIVAGRRPAAADGGLILRTAAKPAGRLARSRDSRCNTGRC